MLCAEASFVRVVQMFCTFMQPAVGESEICLQDKVGVRPLVHVRLHHI